MSILDKCNYVAEEFWYRLDGQICWYDRKIQHWTTYRIDEKGNQISEAKYYRVRADVIAAERRGTFSTFEHNYKD